MENFVMKKLVLLIALISLIGCKKTDIYQSTVTTKKSEKIDTVYVPITVKVPKTIVKTDIKTITNYIEVPGKDRIFYKYNNDSTAILKAQMDSVGNVVIECIGTERELQVEVLTLQKTISLHEKVIEKYKEERTGFGKLMDKIKVMGGFASFLIFILGFILVKQSFF